MKLPGSKQGTDSRDSRESGRGLAGKPYPGTSLRLLHNEDQPKVARWSDKSSDAISDAISIQKKGTRSKSPRKPKPKSQKN